jgi:Putative transposase
VVYSKPKICDPDKATNYLARYFHRIVILNHSLLGMNNIKCTFMYFDYHNGNARRIITYDAEEFIQRSLLHALPDGFVRIRYYGFHANFHRVDKLNLCRELLEVTDVARDGIPQK